MDPMPKADSRIPGLALVIVAEAREWLREGTSLEARRAYRVAVNDVLCALKMYDVAEVVREELGKLFFKKGAGDERVDD